MKTIFWLALLIGFIFVEASTVSLVSSWFALGALAALIASALGAELWLQIVLFFAVSGVCLVLLRPIIKKHFTPKLVKTNVDSVIGARGYVTAAVDNMAATGQVKLGAMYWTARSTSGEYIPKGTLVKVDRIEGVKAFVSPAEEKVIANETLQEV